MRGERRALTNWRGAVAVRGEREAGDVLRRAMAAPQAYDPRRLTHGFHVYPARLHPYLAETLLARAPRGATVLDPFCGSGTVLVQAVARGCRAIGRDINPLAVRIARLKTSVWTAPDLDALTRAGARVDLRARELLAARTQRQPPREARQDFDSHVAWELAGVRDAIAEEGDARRREALRLCLSSILVKASRREGATTERQADKNLPPGRTIRWFTARVEELAAMLADLARAVPPGTPAADVAEGDARTLAGVPDGCVDLALTSPPYAGTYRYAEASAISAYWLGFDVRAAGQAEVGAKGAAGGLAAYRRDLGLALQSMRRVLKPEGRICVVLADLEEGQAIRPADGLLEELGRAAGLAFVAVASQPRVVFGRKGVHRVPGGKMEHLIQFRLGGKTGGEPPGDRGPQPKMAAPGPGRTRR